MAKRTKSTNTGKTTQQTYEKPSPLFEAIRDKDVNKVRELLAAGADLSEKGPDGRTPYQYAHYQRSSEIALMLIDVGAPLAADDLNLYWAVGTGRADVVKKFIDAGADVEFKAIGGTPLGWAV